MSDGFSQLFPASGQYSCHGEDIHMEVTDAGATKERRATFVLDETPTIGLAEQGSGSGNRL
jgi:membrane-bound inhibitor of C-type lysozyme